jgi:hypothetical protein
MRKKVGINRIDPDPTYWKEYNAVRGELAYNHLKIVNCKPDGNSLFRAVSDQYIGDQSKHKLYRGIAV